MGFRDGERVGNPQLCRRYRPIPPGFELDAANAAAEHIG
jgi:hypothetical protein